ncbi:MAG: hypothetical protein KY053_01815, partial [Candidatus Liptonbacteria bacterium]|nr:hypothetical protein [Candidatus Liptonbacteria bacterium]
MVETLIQTLEIGRIFQIIIDVLTTALTFFVYLIWVVPLIALVNLRKIELQKQYIKKFNWQLFELKIPKQNIKTPKAMEQVLVSLYAMRASLDPEEVWLEGKVCPWMSLEIISSKNGIRFFIYAPDNQRNLIESSFFSQYPDIEINVVEDYTKEMPLNLQDGEYDLYGADLVLAAPNPYPIKTYPYFFEGGKTINEEKRADPISIISEVMSNLKSDERIWIQILIQPAEDVLKKEGEKIINKIIGKKAEDKKTSPIITLIDSIISFLKDLVVALYSSLASSAKESKSDEKPQIKFLAPNEELVVKAVLNKMSKLAYKTIIRFLYIDKKSDFTGKNIGAIFGAFRQFGDWTLNGLKPQDKTKTSKPRFFVFFRNQIFLKRKKDIYENYLSRSFPSYSYFPYADIFEPSVLNVEEIATIFHLPIDQLVEASGLRRVEAQRGS